MWSKNLNKPLPLVTFFFGEWDLAVSSSLSLYFAVQNALPCIMRTHVLVYCTWDFAIGVPMHNAHPCFSPQKLGQKRHIMHGKTWYVTRLLKGFGSKTQATSFNFQPTLTLVSMGSCRLTIMWREFTRNPLLLVAFFSCCLRATYSERPR